MISLALYDVIKSCEAEAEILDAKLNVGTTKSHMAEYPADTIQISNYWELSPDESTFANAEGYESEVIIPAMSELAETLNNCSHVEFVHGSSKPQFQLGNINCFYSKAGDIRLFKRSQLCFELQDKGPGLLTTYTVIVRTDPKIEQKIHA